MMWSDGGWSWAAWLAMSVMMLGFGALVVWGLLGISRRPPERQDGGDDILAERLARGEIGEDEYRRLVDLIHSPHRTADNGRSS